MQLNEFKKHTPVVPRAIPLKRAVAYVRVSTSAKSRYGEKTAFEQNPEVQEQPLRDLAQQRGWLITKVYSDRASGAKESRPGLNALMADARRGLFEVVVVWRFDRFARSGRQLVLALEEFRTLGIDFVSHQEALDTSTPMGKAMFMVIAAMAELEHCSIIRERVISGLEHASRNGTRSGCPVGRPRVVLDRERIRQLRDEQKLPWSEVARRVHGSGSVRRFYSSRRHHYLAKTLCRRRYE